MEKLGTGDPKRIGAYRLLARLGAGGMGHVYVARSDRGRTVAVKLVREELAAQEEFRARFRQEVQAARRVGGYWTAPVLDADTEAAVPWVATGYVAGPSLQQVVGRDHGALPERSVRILAAGLAHALTDIHAAGIVHRDLKPSNVLVTIDGPRVIDFGIARALETSAGDGLTRTGSMVGSPGFMAPEQVRGDRITPACDIFCLGSVLAYAASGVLPFGAANSGVHALMFRIAQEEPDLDGVPEGIADLVRDCLRKDPASRPTLDHILERTGAEDTVSGGRSRDPWLPGALVAQLGRHAVQLLDAEDPESTLGEGRTVVSGGGAGSGAGAASGSGGASGPGAASGSGSVSDSDPASDRAAAPGGSASGGTAAPGAGVVPGPVTARDPGVAPVPAGMQKEDPAPGQSPALGQPSVPGQGPALGQPSVPGQGPVPGGSSVPGQGPVPGGSSVPGQGPVPGGSSVPGQGPVPGGSSVPGQGPAPGGSSVPGQSPAPGGLSVPGQSPAPGGPSVPGQSPAPGGPSVPGQSPAPGGPSVPGRTAVPGQAPGPGLAPGPVPGPGLASGQVPGPGLAPGQAPSQGSAPAASPEHAPASDDVSLPPGAGGPRQPGLDHVPTMVAGQPLPPGAPLAHPAYGYPQQHPQLPPAQGHPQQPAAGAWPGNPQPYNPYAGGPGSTPPYGPPPVGATQPYGPGVLPPQEPSRGDRRSTVLLVVIALVVALAAGGSVYALMQGNTGRDDKGSGTVSPAPSTGAPTTPGPSPTNSASASASASETPSDGAVPDAYLGTWKASIDNATGHSTRELTLTQGEVDDTVLELVADGPVAGGGTYHCVFQAKLTERPSGDGPLRIGPSTVTSGEPLSSCSPGEATDVTLLPDGRLRRESQGGGETLTYTRQ